MSVIREAWAALRTVASLIDKMDGYDRRLDKLTELLVDTRERLIRIEAQLDFAQSLARRPSLPPSDTDD